MAQVILKTKAFIKNPNTKTSYILESESEELISKKQYNNIVSDDTCKWFRRLGGTETKSMCYTFDGYNCIKLVSKSPNKQIKKVREFIFINTDLQEIELKQMFIESKTYLDFFDWLETHFV